VYTTPVATRLLTQSLKANGAQGSEVVKLAKGVALGVQAWLPKLRVQSLDSGTAGAGVGTGPLVLPSRVLYQNLLVSFKQAGLAGEFSPNICMGLAQGLSGCFDTMTYQTAHPVVSSGVGVGTVQPPPGKVGVPAILQGLNGAGLTGQTVPQLAGAIEQGLRVSVNSLVFSIPIVGPTTPTAASGAGFGKVS
jgi:hypothetical protein